MRAVGIFFLPTLLLGLVIGAQLQTQATRSPISSRYSADLADAATTMQRDQDRLRDQIVSLRAQLDRIQAQAATVDERAASLQRQVDELKAAAGLTPLSGSGVVITLDDGRLPANAPRRSIELAIVHSQDITDVFNAAWKAGATGIAVNGERITSASACVGATIQINGRSMSPPFVVSVVGSSERLLGALTDQNQLRDLKRRSELYGLRLAMERAPAVALPAYTGPIPVREARPAPTVSAWP